MSRKLAWLMLVMFSLGSAASAASTPSDAVVPTADRYAVANVNQVDTISPPALDLPRLGREDMARDEQGLPPRFAVSEKVALNPSNHGTWEDLGDGQMLWRLRIVGGQGTTSLNLGFTRYKLAEDARLQLYATDGSQHLKPFTAADNEAHGELWTPVITARDIVVELTVSRAAREGLELEIGSINQGYRGFGTISDASYIKSGSCNLDVECLAPGDTWRDEMRAVGVISTGGSTFCTGSLINNTANDHKMFFITANHCSINSGNAASLVVYWNYQNSFCRTPGSTASGQAGDGSLAQFHTGSFFRAAYSPSDVTLVELDDPPVVAYNHHWEGWDRSTGDFTCTPGAPCACIHHPDTDEKRITYVTTNTATTTYLGTTSPGDGTHVWAHWATDPPGPFTVPGVTEPGSSGSPLYNANGQFIGQLHGGLSACGATGDSLSDYYGRFSLSWTGGATNSTRVSNWLDAGNTGATSINGIDNCTSPGAPTIGTATATAPNQIQVTWTDGSPSSAQFKVYRAVGTCASPGAFSSVATGLAGSPYNDTTVSGGTTYAYRVTGFDPTGGCESAQSACVQATATGACTLPPTFAGLASVSNNATTSCGLSLSWVAGTANCGGPITYNIYRSTTAGFTPGPGNLIASGVSGTGYTDTSGMTNGTTYYYIVRAVDGSNSVADANTVERSSAPTGPITTSTLTETFEGSASGGGFDNPGWTHNAILGSVDWAQSADQAQTPTHSWFSDSQTSPADRVLVSPSFVPQASTTLSFWHTYDFETNTAGTACYDAGTLEISTDGGTTWATVPDAAFTAGGFNDTVEATFQSPIASKRAWCQGAIGTMTQVTANLSSFVGSADSKLRWRQGDDVSLAEIGWYVDSVTIANAGVAGTCSGAPAVGLDYHTVTPCRLVDTRNADGPLGGPALQPSANRTFVVSGSCGIPSSAKAVTVNVTVIQPTGTGYLTLFPSNQAAPVASTINFIPDVIRGNNATVQLSTNGAGGIGVKNGSAGTAHFALDVTGYYDEEVDK